MQLSFRTYLFCILSVGCVTFDPSLLHRDAASESDHDAGTDGNIGSPDANTSDAMPHKSLSVQDICGAPDTLELTTSTSLTIDTRELQDNFTDTSGCTGHMSVGNDAFLKIHTQPSEKWHFHVHAIGGGDVANPVLYLTQACDPRQCAHFSDTCEDGSDEHFTFTASAAGDWFLGIDDRNPGGRVYQVEAIHPTCGNGPPAEHGEVCDDGNKIKGDGCDNLCRRELTGANPAEVEPNDDESEANVLEISGAGATTITIGGNLSGCPISDFFAVKVLTGESVRATLLDASQNPCTSVPAGVTLGLSMRSSEGNELGQGSISGANACPAIGATANFASNLAEGLYYVVVSGSLTPPVGVHRYQLKVEIVPAP